MLLSALFAFYLALYFLRLHEYRPETAQTSILFLTLAICAVMYVLKRDKNLKVVQTPLIIGFVVSAILSHVVHFYLAATIATADELVRLAILYLICASLFIERKRLDFYIKYIAIFAVIIALHGIYQFHNGVGWTGMLPLIRQEVVRIRYIGVFNDPNDMGMLLAIALPFIVYTIKQYKNIALKLFWLSTLPIILYAIYLTGSRGTILGVLVMLFAYAWFYFKKSISIALGMVMLPVAFVYTKLSTISNEDASSAGRVDAWGAGMQMLKSNPLFGVGHDTFKDHHVRAAHNSYVEVFSEVGLIGYFFWLSFIMMSAYGLYKFSFKYSLTESASSTKIEQFKKDKSICSTIMFSMIAFMVTAFFISRSIQPLIFVLCAMSAGLYYQLQQAYPDFEHLSFRNTFKINVFLTVGTVLFVYIAIRIFW